MLQTREPNAAAPPPLAALLCSFLLGVLLCNKVFKLVNNYSQWINDHPSISWEHCQSNRCATDYRRWGWRRTTLTETRDLPSKLRFRRIAPKTSAGLGFLHFNSISFDRTPLSFTIDRAALSPTPMFKPLSRLVCFDFFLRRQSSALDNAKSPKTLQWHTEPFHDLQQIIVSATVA